MKKALTTVGALFLVGSAVCFAFLLRQDERWVIVRFSHYENHSTETVGIITISNCTRSDVICWGSHFSVATLPVSVYDGHKWVPLDDWGCSAYLGFPIHPGQTQNINVCMESNITWKASVYCYKFRLTEKIYSKIQDVAPYAMQRWLPHMLSSGHIESGPSISPPSKYVQPLL